MNARKGLLCFFLLLLCLSMTAHAEENSRVTVNQAGGRHGETVTVDVSLAPVNGIAGGHFNVVYDSGLALVSAEAGLGGGTVNPHYAENTVRVSFAGTRPLPSSGSLLRLTFRIKEEASLGLLPVRVEGQKFYNVAAEPVPVELVPGGVLVQAVKVTLSSESCLPGQAVKLDLKLEGELYPAGGEFDLVYNKRLLTAGSVKAEQKMGNTAINLSYNIDAEEGVVHVIWAASEPIGEQGRLCTVIFAVPENTSGKTDVRIENPKFFDETGSRMECLPPEDGAVTIVNQYKEQPTLYVVGGKLADDGKTAVVQIAVDGAGVVCGGAFQVSYDPALCSLTAAEPQMPCVAVNPEGTSKANGTIAVSWAEDSPALDNKPVLELTFRLTDSAIPAALQLNQVVLKDNLGQNVENTRVDGGKIGISSSLQKPDAELIQEEDSIGIQAVLYDAEFCGDKRTSAVQVLLAAYSNGKFSLLTLPTNAVTFDHNGIARVSLDVRYDPSISELQLFVLDVDGQMTPLCEKAEFSVSA